MTIEELDDEIKSLEDQIALNNSPNDVRNYDHSNKKHQRQIELCRLAKIGLDIEANEAERRIILEKAMREYRSLQENTEQKP